MWRVILTENFGQNPNPPSAHPLLPSSLPLKMWFHIKIFCMGSLCWAPQTSTLDKGLLTTLHVSLCKPVIIFKLWSRSVHATHSKFHIYVNFPGVEFLGIAPKFRKTKTIVEKCVYCAFKIVVYCLCWYFYSPLTAVFIINRRGYRGCQKLRQ